MLNHVKTHPIRRFFGAIFMMAKQSVSLRAAVCIVASTKLANLDGDEHSQQSNQSVGPGAG